MAVKRYPTKDILTLAKYNEGRTLRVDNKSIAVTDLMRLMIKKGIKCDICGFESDIFVLKEKVHKKWIGHFTSSINDRYLTIEHIIPSCAGGSNSLYNKVPTCNICNNEWKSELDRTFFKERIIGVGCTSSDYLTII